MFSIIVAFAALTGGNLMTNAVKEDTTTTAPSTVYAHELDAQAYSGTDLGASYSKQETTFKVWAPTASGVSVKLYKTGSSQEKGAQDISTTAMTKGENGVWSATVKGDNKNLYYTYLVTINGVTRETADVYAKAAGVNGNRSMIVDLPSTDPEGWSRDEHVLCNDPTDAIVWEVHVKDFSHSEVSGVSMKYRGKYLAFTESGTTLADKGEYPTCIDYLKKLGVTHVQLLPVYDYATVDESQTDSDEFNWGYDPKNYNVPEGSYSTNPFDGNVRITEFKQMIMALHKAGIGVIMDVVFNHTFTAEGGWFELTVPGYYYRMKADGSFSDGSGCGNETASDHLMYRKYMIDSILYWTNEYHIDGFRFDLMGVHDVDTMNEIRKALDTGVNNGKKIILYGEPWTGGETTTKAVTAVKANLSKLDNRVGAFSDEFRDAVKGHVFNAYEKGFVQEGGSVGYLMSGIKGMVSTGVNQPSQTVSYVSAHDNFTLYDKLVLSVKNDMSYSERDERLVDMNRLAAALVLTSQGISFMQAGEEFARSKQGDENSFISPAGLNELDWQRALDFSDLVSYYQGLIEIRRSFKPFRDPTTKTASLINFVDSPDKTVAYTIENILTNGREWSQAALLFNASEEEETITLTPPSGKTLPSEWVIVVNKTEAGLNSLGTIKGNKVTLPPCSAMMLVDKESFDKLGLTSEYCVVRAEYRDSETKELLGARTYKGSAGSAFATAENKALDTEYDLEKTEGKVMGHFTKEPQTVTYFYKKFDGKIVDLTVNYLKKRSEALGGGSVEAEKSYTCRVREGEDYTAMIRSIEGMELDLSSFPANSAGTAGKEDITVDFFYKDRETCDLILHYYNSEGWDKTAAYVYKKDDDELTEYTSADGDIMKTDPALGEGWYTITIENAGSSEGVHAVFSDSKGNKDSSFGSAGCEVTKEVWIKDGKLTNTGTLNVVYLSKEGSVLESKVIYGKVGDSYALEDKSFEGLELQAFTANTEGSFTDEPIYVVYKYAKPVPSDNDKKLLPVIFAVTAGAALLAAAGLFIGYRSRKKHSIK